MIVNDRTIAPPIHDPELDRRVKDAGASKTVYALVTPETEAAKSFILGNAVAGPDTARRHRLEQFRDAWTGKQYASHEAFIERWMAWAAPLVTIDAAGFLWRYPTAGGSEALFHVIAAYGNRGAARRGGPDCPTASRASAGCAARGPGPARPSRPRSTPRPRT